MNTIATYSPNLGEDIIFVFGGFCSGKTSFIKEHYPTANCIYVSSLVKQKIASNDRNLLTQTEDLDFEIATNIIEIMNSHELFNPYFQMNGGRFVIDGIRQLTILNYLLFYIHRSNNKIKLIWLEVPDEIRKQRYNKRAAEKDNQITFEEATEMDERLAFSQLKAELFAKKDQFKLNIIHNY